MSLLLERAMVTDSGIASRGTDEKSLKSILPKLKDRVSAKLIIRGVNDSVIKPILKAKGSNKTMETYEESVDRFAIMMSALEELILVNNRDKMRMIIEADRSFYRQYAQSIQDNSSWIPTEYQKQVSEIVNIFQDYQNVVLGILSKNRQLTSETLAEINTEEWIRSIYGTLLSIFCVFRLMETKKHKHDLRKLGALIQMVGRYAEVLDSYSDTLDILTNPQERELLQKAENL